MDSERFFFLDQEMDVSEVQELLPDEQRDFEHHVEICRHLQEIHQLYQIVLFNLSIMRHNYVWINTGDVYYKRHPAEGERHFINVNAMIINLIGSARTLTESMDCYMAENYEPNDPSSRAYFDFTHAVYDRCFAYRFLIRLRDFSQHGHPPVSNTGANYYFDLRQIYHMPHFTHNKQMKAQLSSAVTEIMDIFHDTPTLGITMTVAEFIVELWKIYQYFLSCVETHLRESFEQIKAIQDRYPENVRFASNTFPGTFIYAIKDRHADVVTVDSNAMEMLRKYQMEAEDTLKDYQKDWIGLKSAMKFITTDGQFGDPWDP